TGEVPILVGPTGSDRIGPYSGWFSPDSKFFSYASDDGVSGNHRAYALRLGTGEAAVLISPDDPDFVLAPYLHEYIPQLEALLYTGFTDPGTSGGPSDMNVYLAALDGSSVPRPLLQLPEGT